MRGSVRRSQIAEAIEAVKDRDSKTRPARLWRRFASLTAPIASARNLFKGVLTHPPPQAEGSEFNGSKGPLHQAAFHLIVADFLS